MRIAYNNPLKKSLKKLDLWWIIPNHNPDLNLRPIGPNRDEDSENRQNQINTDGRLNQINYEMLLEKVNKEAKSLRSTPHSLIETEA